MRDKSIVTSRKVTRWYVHGRGYTSRLQAYMQIAKRAIDREMYAQLTRQKVNWAEWVSLSRQWRAERYPYQNGCNCNFCSQYRRGVLVTEIASAGCWISRMAELRKVAREIMSGERDETGRPVLALPEFVEMVTGKSLAPYQRVVIENLSDKKETMNHE